MLFWVWVYVYVCTSVWNIPLEYHDCKKYTWLDAQVLVIYSRSSKQCIWRGERWLKSAEATCLAVIIRLASTPLQQVHRLSGKSMWLVWSQAQFPAKSMWIFLFLSPYSKSWTRDSRRHSRFWLGKDDVHLSCCEIFVQELLVPAQLGEFGPVHDGRCPLGAKTAKLLEHILQRACHHVLSWVLSIQRCCEWHAPERVLLVTWPGT